ncbi:hypothetical protein [Asaia astilbis]|uniref:hypothetical protein n=1 Tax=Asaia astilbis TaxID=610244 RepID=UPI000471A5A9|nr:hypothetical protein [Asaia astilbis]
MKRRASQRQRYGVHARSVMADPRWLVLPLSARGMWLHLTDIADAMPELRAPARGKALALADLARLLAADPSEVVGAISHLINRDIIEPVSDGYRLKAF